MKSFADDWGSMHKKRHGKFGKVNRNPKVPTERIFCSTLQQCPKEEVIIYSSWIKKVTCWSENKYDILAMA